MTDDSDPLFEPFELDDATLDNRVGLAPMTRVSSSDDGRPTERMAPYYAKFADGGFSFLLTEGTYTDDAYSQGYADQPGLVTDEQTAAWRRVTEAVHDAGRPIFAQLMHAGAQAQHNDSVEEGETIAPSAVRPNGEMAGAYGGSGAFPRAKAATREELDEAKRGFVDAARNAVEAGFDGVEIHAANGYFLNEFVASDFNHCTDEYGGDPEARARFPAEVVSAVVEATPDDFVVGVRVSQTKVTHEGYEWKDGEETAAAVFGALSEAGADYVHVAEPNVITPAFGDSGPTLTELAAEYGDTVVVANGGLADPEAARTAVADGADLLTLATGALANPDWPDRVADGADADDLESFDPSAFLAPSAEISEFEVPAEARPSDD